MGLWLSQISLKKKLLQRKSSSYLLSLSTSLVTFLRDLSLAFNCSREKNGSIIFLEKLCLFRPKFNNFLPFTVGAFPNNLSIFYLKLKLFLDPRNLLCCISRYIQVQSSTRRLAAGAWTEGPGLSRRRRSRTRRTAMMPVFSWLHNGLSVSSRWITLQWAVFWSRVWFAQCGAGFVQHLSEVLRRKSLLFLRFPFIKRPVWPSCASSNYVDYRVTSFHCRGIVRGTN